MKPEHATGLRVVLVDDSDLVRQRLHALLNGRRGITVVGHANSVTTGLSVIGSTQPDVVIVDVMMPDESGFDLLERLGELEEAPKAIVLTNYPYPAFRKRALDLGAEHFLAKSTEFARIPDLLVELAPNRESD